MIKNVIYKILEIIILNYNIFNKIILNRDKNFIFKI